MMSSFHCEICHKDILDSPTGYITGCEHYPIEGMTAKEQEISNMISLIADVYLLKEHKHKDIDWNFVKDIALRLFDKGIRSASGFVGESGAFLRPRKYEG